VLEQGWITDRPVGSRLPAFTRGNAGEVLPDPVSPLGWTLLWESAIVKGARDGFIEFGLLDWDEFEWPDEPECFGMFGGYFYNPLSLVRLMGARLPGGSPEAVDRAYFDARPDVPPYVFEAWHESDKHAAKLAQSMGWVLTTETFPQVDAEKELADKLRNDRPDLAGLWDGALLARARSMLPYLQQFFETSIWASLGASVGPGALGAIAEGLGDPTLVVRLLGGIEVDSARPSFAMWELSRLVRSSTELTAAFEEGLSGLLDRLAASGAPSVAGFGSGFDSFVHDYGSRGPNEWDLRARTWETHPELALAAIDRMRRADDEAAPTLRQAHAVVERDAAAAEVRQLLAGDAEALAGFETALRSATVFLAGRERYKTNMIKVIGEVRVCVLELARRMVERGALDDVEQIHLLLADELDHFRHEPSSFTEVLRERERGYRALFDVEPPFIVNGSVPPMALRKGAGIEGGPVGAGAVLTGVGGSSGVATGRARVVRDPGDPSALEVGDVLVTANTDPSWTPLFVTASAVVVNVGAIGSHAMIVSRELGIPCVVSVRDATERIPDGALVTVDGTAGTVLVH